jgi:hypothetical protein
MSSSPLVDLFSRALGYEPVLRSLPHDASVHGAPILLCQAGDGWQIIEVPFGAEVHAEGVERLALGRLAAAHPRALFAVTIDAQPRHLVHVTRGHGTSEPHQCRRLPIAGPPPETRRERLSLLHARHLGAQKAAARAWDRAFDVPSLHEDFLAFAGRALVRLRETYGDEADDALCAILCGVFLARDDADERCAELRARYDFTPHEATPDGVEVAIDPSVIGTLLERRTGRKSTGRYYTPWPITHYMCREALSAHLGEAAGELLALPPCREPSEPLSKTEAERLRHALLACRVCDPAVGSGAFLIGMLHEMARLLARLDRRLYGEDAVAQPGYRLKAKRQLLGCLHGADLEEAASRRTQLRLWLSLAAELPREVPTTTLGEPSQIDTLVCGDALLGAPFADERFHIVIGNPPYLFGEQLGGQRAALMTRFELARGQFDAYWLFYERALSDLLLPGGVHCLITSDALLARDETLPLRRLVLSRSSVRLVSHVGRVFDGVGVSAVVLLGVLGKEAAESYALVPYDARTQRFCPSRQNPLAQVLRDPKLRFGESDRHAELSAPYCFGDFFTISRGEELGKKHLPRHHPVTRTGTVPVLAGEGVSRYRQPRPTHTVASAQVRKRRDVYLSPKIVVVKTGAHFVAAVDDEGLVTLQSVYNLRPKGRLSCAVGCALLNSAALGALLRARITGQKKLFPQITQDNVLEMPVPDLSEAHVLAIEEATRTLRTSVLEDARREAEATINHILEDAFQPS